MEMRPTEAPDHVAHTAAGPSDEALLEGFLRGEDSMFARLVHRHERPLYAFIARVTGQTQDAPDLFQETFVRVFQHAGSFAGRSSFRTWLYAIALNVCRSYGRALGRRKRETALPAADPPAASPGPGRIAERREIGRRVAGAVATLPGNQREVFILKAYEGMHYARIAQTLGRPLGTVKSQMRLALVKMRRALQDIAAQDASGAQPV
jgi:RNA polymerase sigma-70 factor, ECF subfamily